MVCEPELIQVRPAHQEMACWECCRSKPMQQRYIDTL